MSKLPRRSTGRARVDVYGLLGLGVVLALAGGILAMRSP